MTSVSGETPDFFERPLYQFSTASTAPPATFRPVGGPSKPSALLGILRRHRRVCVVLLVLLVALSSLGAVGSAHPRADAWRAQALARLRAPDWERWQLDWWAGHEPEADAGMGTGIGLGSSSASSAALGSGRRRCDFCDPTSELCQTWGASKLSRALLYQGSNARLHRFIQRARAGDGFTMGVIGGSVSSGHGVGCQPSWFCENNMHRRIFDHLDALFPARNGSSVGVDAKHEGKNSLVNGAQPATGSGYFSFCFGEHIPSDVDLVITELSINDQVTFDTVDTYELLLRGLLDLPSQPAVINAQMFALLFATMYSGGDLQASAGAFLDVPTISLRSLVLPDVLADNSLVREYFAYAPDRNKPADYSDVDQRHLGPKGHKIMAELVNAYVDMQVCEVDSGSSRTEIPEMPRMRMWQHWDPNTVTLPIKPECSSTNSHYGEKLTPSVWGGWRQWDWKGEKHYLVADTPGSTISFPVHISARGELILSYQRSAKYGLGNCKCWVDEDSDRAVLVVGYWDATESLQQLAVVRNDLKPGDHTLHCELLDETADPGGGTEFRIVAVMA